MIRLPQHWTQRGELPPVEFDRADESARTLFDEDIVQIVDPTGMLVLDVGWYPSENPEGHFICQLIHNDEWDEPIQEFITRSVAKAENWINGMIEAIEGEHGHEGQMEENAVLTVYVGQRQQQSTPTWNEPPGTNTGAPLTDPIELVPEYA